MFQKLVAGHGWAAVCLWGLLLCFATAKTFFPPICLSIDSVCWAWFSSSSMKLGKEWNLTRNGFLKTSYGTTCVRSSQHNTRKTTSDGVTCVKDQPVQHNTVFFTSSCLCHCSFPRDLEVCHWAAQSKLLLGDKHQAPKCHFHLGECWSDLQ